MLTGKRTFSGDDVTEVIAAVIRDVPDLDALPSGSPPALRRLLRRCLEKDPAKRLRDIGDAGLEINEALVPPEESAADEPAAAGGLTWVHVVAAAVPDGRLLAYISNESGEEEVYVRRYPELDLRVAVSTSGGTEPVWSRDSQTLFFRSQDGIMSATRIPGEQLEFTVPEVLFADIYVRNQGGNHLHFDVAEDGRLLFVSDPNANSGRRTVQEQFHVVLNWTEMLKRLAPTGR